MLTTTLIAMIAAVAAPNVANATPSGADAPPPCIHVGDHCYEPCPDPSGMCPPSDTGYAPIYSWVGTGTGTYWQDEFTGTAINSSVWQEQGQGSVSYGAGGSTVDNLYEPGAVQVSGGELHLMTYYDTKEQYESACLSLYGADECWIEGGVTQCGNASEGTCTSSYEPWMTSGQIAIEAKVTTAVSGVDATIQEAGKGWGDQSSTTYGANCNVYTTPECAYPPEMDIMENGNDTLANFSSTLHCAGANPPVKASNTQDTIPYISDYLNSGGVGAWNAYELDWIGGATPEMQVFVNGGTTPVWQAVDGGDLSGKDQSGSPWPIHCSTTYWPSSPSAAMGTFMQQVVLGSPGSTSDTSELDVDWIAELAN